MELDQRSTPGGSGIVATLHSLPQLPLAIVVGSLIGIGMPVLDQSLGSVFAPICPSGQDYDLLFSCKLGVLTLVLLLGALGGGIVAALVMWALRAHSPWLYLPATLTSTVLALMSGGLMVVVVSCAIVFGATSLLTARTRARWVVAVHLGWPALVIVVRSVEGGMVGLFMKAFRASW